MIIDIHNHPDWLSLDLPGVLANMDQYHIDVTWLLSVEAPQDEHEPHGSRAFLPKAGGGTISALGAVLRYRDAAPDRFLAGYCPDPRRPEALDLMAQAVEVHKVRVAGELKLRMTYDNPDALRLFRYCGEQKLPVITHIDYPLDSGAQYPRPNYWYGGGVEALGRAAAACPETIFFGHGPGWWATLSGDGLHVTEAYPSSPVAPGGMLPRMLHDLPNLYGDLSGYSGANGLTRDPAFAREFLLEFQDRLCYARDLFDNRQQEALEALDLPAEVLEKIYSGNALRLVPLEA
jgi:predicted TIM-barrel fold metal-dependent hydrolase